MYSIGNLTKMRENKCVLLISLKGEYKLHGHTSDEAIKKFQY